jgi:hypothetical protein
MYTDAAYVAPRDNNVVPRKIIAKIPVVSKSTAIVNPPKRKIVETSNILVPVVKSYSGI